MSHTDAVLSVDAALDERQRSMLEAMGIKHWIPNANDQANAIPVSQAAAAPIQKSNFTTDLDRNQSTLHTNYAQDAIENEASSSLNTKVTATSTGLFPRPAGIEHMDWPTLRRAVSNCQACGLCQLRKNAVFGIGPMTPDDAHAPQTDWLIVGEPPEEDEDRLGEPFVGDVGKLLDNMLAAMKVGSMLDGKPTGLSRHKGAYAVNVLKCRPPANRNPSPEEVAMCEPYLARQIELLRPKIILAMGKFAIQSLIGSNEPVGKLRGRVHALKHANFAAPVIVTYHPAYLLRNLPDKAKAWADLLLAMQTYSELSASNSQH